MTFEENMNALSEIVGQLEKGDLPLEKAVELYGSGVKLAQDCRKELEGAKLKITRHEEDKSGAEV